MTKSPRRLARAANRKPIREIDPRVLEQLGIDPDKPVSPQTHGVAAFREAVEFQQFMSEIVNHIHQTLSQIPEDNDLHGEVESDYLHQVEATYFEARMRVLEYGSLAAVELDPEKEESVITPVTSLVIKP